MAIDPIQITPRELARIVANSLFHFGEEETCVKLRPPLTSHLRYWAQQSAWHLGAVSGCNAKRCVVCGLNIRWASNGPCLPSTRRRVSLGTSTIISWYDFNLALRNMKWPHDCEAAATIFFTRSRLCSSSPPPPPPTRVQFPAPYGGSTRISLSTSIDSPLQETSLHAFSSLSNIFWPSGEAWGVNHGSKRQKYQYGMMRWYG